MSNKWQHKAELRLNGGHVSHNIMEHRIKFFFSLVWNHVSPWGEHSETNGSFLNGGFFILRYFWIRWKKCGLLRFSFFSSTSPSASFVFCSESHARTPPAVIQWRSGGHRGVAWLNAIFLCSATRTNSIAIHLLRDRRIMVISFVCLLRGHVWCYKARKLKSKMISRYVFHNSGRSLKRKRHLMKGKQKENPANSTEWILRICMYIYVGYMVCISFFFLTSLYFYNTPV